MRFRTRHLSGRMLAQQWSVWSSLNVVRLLILPLNNKYALCEWHVFQESNDIFLWFCYKTSVAHASALIFLRPLWSVFPFPAPFSFVTLVHPEVTLCSGGDIKLKKQQQKTTHFSWFLSLSHILSWTKELQVKVREKKEEVKLSDGFRCVPVSFLVI